MLWFIVIVDCMHYIAIVQCVPSHTNTCASMFLSITAVQGIEDNYSGLDAIYGPRFMVQFENDTISLVIPEDGVRLENGWTITPLVPPVVSL